MKNMKKKWFKKKTKNKTQAWQATTSSCDGKRECEVGRRMPLQHQREELSVCGQNGKPAVKAAVRQWYERRPGSQGDHSPEPNHPKIFVRAPRALMEGCFFIRNIFLACC